MSDKHLDWFVKEQLLPSEEVIASVQAQRDKEGLNGLVILTDQRIVFVRKGTFSTKYEPWAIERISSVETKNGLLFYSIKLHTSGDDLDLRTGDKVGGAKLVSALQAALHSTSSASSSARNFSDGPLEKLQKLSDLHAAGVLTDDEFAQKKAELLAQI